MNLFDLCVYKNLNKGSGGDVDVSSLVATENKTYNAGEGKAYNPVVVNVPEPVLDSITINENGHYTPPAGVDGFGRVIVDVPTPPPSLQSLTASHNGYFLPSSGYDGFSEVNVDVALPQNAYLLESQKNDVVTIQHGAEFDMPKLIASIEPQQDLHGYDSPWVGGSGKNKFETTATSKTESGVTWAVNSDGSITVSGTATGYTSIGVGEARVQSSMGKVTISGISGTTNLAWGGLDLKDENDNVLYNITSGSTYDNFTVDLSQYPSAYKITMTIKRNNNGAISGTIKPQVELGQTATTFAPYSNECPISGWTACNVVRSGVNVWDEEWEVGTISTSTGEYSASGDRVCSKNYIRVEPNKSYYKQNFAWQFYYDEYKNFISATSIADGVFTTPNNAHYMKFYTSSEYGQTYNNDISINYPSTDTSYHAYNGQTYTINFVDGSSPLTVYGGTLDVLSGVLTVDRANVDLGTLDWIYTPETNRERFSATLSGVKWVSNSIPINAICSALDVVDFFSVYGHVTDNAIGMWNGTTLAVYSSAYTDVATFKTAMNGVQLVYELDTPQTYQLTPTQVKSLLGVNNIFADTGEVDVQIWTKEVTS